MGKSTLFNRLTQTRTAIVNDTAGTTRDRQYGKVDWCGKEFSIVDTGGWVVNSDDIFESEINKQVHLAIEEADVILFVVDAMNGVTDLDDHVAEILRRSKKPVILVANKVDSNDWLYNVPEFYSLGLGEPYPVSASNGSGTGDLLDEVVKDLPEEDDTEEQLERIPRFAIVGRPNAGKSSIINSFIGEDRNIYAIQQVRLRLLSCRHRRNTQENQGKRGHRVLLGYPLDTRHRGIGCVHPHD